MATTKKTRKTRPKKNRGNRHFMLRIRWSAAEKSKQNFDYSNLPASTPPATRTRCPPGTCLSQRSSSRSVLLRYEVRWQLAAFGKLLLRTAIRFTLVVRLTFYDRPITRCRHNTTSRLTPVHNLSLRTILKPDLRLSKPCLKPVSIRKVTA